MYKSVYNTEENKGKYRQIERKYNTQMNNSGTTTRGGNERDGEYQDDMINKKEESDAWRHC